MTTDHLHPPKRVGVRCLITVQARRWTLLLGRGGPVILPLGRGRRIEVIAAELTLRLGIRLLAFGHLETNFAYSNANFINMWSPAWRAGFRGRSGWVGAARGAGLGAPFVSIAC